MARAAEHALRALGVARARDVERHFTIGRYPGLDLERAGWAKRLIGRVVPRMDRRRGELVVEGTFAEPEVAGEGAPPDGLVAAAIQSLASFAGATSVSYSGPVAFGVS